MKKNVLVLGGYGFIGSNLVKKLLDLNMKVTVIDDLDPYSGGNLYNLEKYINDIDFIKGSISDYELVCNSVKNKDYIFNCAASTSHTLSMKKPWLNLKINCEGVINILEAIRRYNIDSKFVHISTTTQLGKLIYTPADEKHPEFPRDIYSANKMVSEKYVLLYQRTYNVKSVVIRLPNVYGPMAAIHSPDLTFNNYFIGLALQNKPITVFKPGTQLRNTIYIDDAIKALTMSAFSNINTGIYQAVHDDHLSVMNIAKKTVEIIGGSLNLIDWPSDREMFEIGDAVLSNKEIKKVLGWMPKIKLEDGLKKTKDYFIERIDRYLK